jgi:hypothetical protein
MARRARNAARHTHAHTHTDTHTQKESSRSKQAVACVQISLEVQRVAHDRDEVVFVEQSTPALALGEIVKVIVQIFDVLYGWQVSHQGSQQPGGQQGVAHARSRTQCKRLRKLDCALGGLERSDQRVQAVGRLERKEARSKLALRTRHEVAP